VHDFSDSNKILDIAIDLAKADGIQLPDRDSLRSKSFLGTSNYFIIDSSGTTIHQVKVARIKRILSTQVSIAETEQLAESEKPWGQATCSTCRYWDSDGVTGLCRRYPKQAASDWATTHILDWCGEHETTN